MDLCLTQALHRAVRQHPKKIVTIHGQRRQDYATMRHRVACLASALRALGVAPGDRVAILSLNSDRYAEYYFAVYWAGGVVNPVNVRWSAAEIAYSLNDCDTRILFIDDPFLPMLSALRQQAACLNTVIHCGDGATPAQSLSYETLIADHAPVEDARRGGEDLAGVFYTGGTTGFPKGVMLSHRALYLNALELMTHGIDASHGIGLHAAPMFHLADHVMFNALFIGGGTHVMLSMFDPKRVAETIEREGVSMTLMVPIMIQALVDSEPAHEHDMSSLKELLYGGAPMNEAVIDRTLARLPQARMCQAYGMTELAAIATILPHYYHSKEARSVGKCRSAGLPSAICEMRIVDKDGNEASRGTVGEVAVRSPCAMQGYWNKPELTRQALRGGWMHTGDGGYMDADGFIFIVDRLKDMIITGGENVYSVEVENAVATHDAVLQCATIAVPDEQWGELVHVCVVLRPGATLDLQSLHAHCVPLIANYKIPRSLEILEKLPVSGAGKVLKSKLREKYWSGIGRNVG